MPDSTNENIVKILADSMQESLDRVDKQDPIKAEKRYIEMTTGENSELAAQGLFHVAESFKEQYGVTVSVEKSVTDSMWLYNLSDSCFLDVKWISPSIRLEFEDKDLLAIELHKGDTSTFCAYSAYKYEESSQEGLEVGKFFDLLDADPVMKRGGEMIAYKIFANDRQYAMGYLPSWVSYTKYAEIVNKGEKSDFNNTSTPQKQYILDSIMRAFKVMAFASVPRLAPAPIKKSDIKARKKLKAKGVKIPNKGSLYRVVYLPKIIEEYSRKHYKEGNGKALKNGRVGHLRYYKHERFTNKQGTWDLMPPICDANGNLPKVLYKVRKPKIETEEIKNYEEVANFLDL